MNSSFTKKILRFTFTLDGGVFDTSGNDTLTVQGLRSQISISQASGILAQADIQIYGLLQSDMNALTTFRLMGQFSKTGIQRNTVMVEAGDEETGLTTVFFGDIVNSCAEYQGAPDVYLKIEAMVNANLKLAPAKTLSYKGLVDAKIIFQDIAKNAGMELEIDDSLSRNIRTPYLTGSAINQARTLADAIDCDIVYEGNNKMVVVSKGVARKQKGEVPHLDKWSGLINYPSFDNYFCLFDCLYRPDIVMNGAVNVVLPVELANKVGANIGAKQDNNEVITTWYIQGLSIILTAETPHGLWAMKCSAQNNQLLPA